MWTHANTRQPQWDRLLLESSKTNEFNFAGIFTCFEVQIRSRDD